MSERSEHHQDSSASPAAVDLATPPAVVRWDLGERPELRRAQEKICAIRLGLRVLGIEERFVRGLRQVAGVTPVPLTPEHVLGVTAVDGAIVPLLDIAPSIGEKSLARAELEQTVGAGRDAGEGDAARPYTALLVELDAETLLIAIDEVVGLEKREAELDAAPDDGIKQDDGMPWTAGSAPILGRPIPLLDLPGLLRKLRPVS